MNLVTHPMRGFDAQLAQQSLRIPKLFKINAIIAVGRPGELDVLSGSQREREVPSERKLVAEFAHEGEFPER